MVTEAAFVIIMLIVMLALMVVMFASMIWSILDIVKAKNEGNWKIMWILIVALLGIIGIIIYLIVGRRDRKK